MTRLLVVSMSLALAAACAPANPVEHAAQTLGVDQIQTVQFTGTGDYFQLGQSANPNAPWPRFNLTAYQADIDYGASAMRLEVARTQGEDPPRGGGGQPLVGERQQVQFVHGDDAWTLAGDTARATPAAVAELRAQILLTPHGFIRAARAGNATVSEDTRDGRTIHTISFTDRGASVTGVVNADGLVEHVETLIPNTVLGDMPFVAHYADYAEIDGGRFPMRITHEQGGAPTLDLTVSAVRPNAEVEIGVPDGVAGATSPPVTVESEEVADGVWHLRGGSHHSVLIEFQDHVAVIEAPLDEERSRAVLAEASRLVPEKPVRYVVNTHHHFDHSGGLRAYAAEGITVITHEMNRPFYERVWASPRTLLADQTAAVTPTFETMTERHELTDGTRLVELHLIQGNGHNDGIVMAYLPKERILVEADAFNPGPPDAPPPDMPNVFSVNLFENIQRLGLDVARILPIHGRIVTLEDLRLAIGRTS